LKEHRANIRDAEVEVSSFSDDDTLMAIHTSDALNIDRLYFDFSKVTFRKRRGDIPKLVNWTLVHGEKVDKVDDDPAAGTDNSFWH